MGTASFSAMIIARRCYQCWLSPTFETPCAVGAPLLMKKSILRTASSRREDDQRYTVYERAFETVLRCLDEPLHVASAAKAESESTKKILKENRHPPGGCHPRIKKGG